MTDKAYSVQKWLNRGYDLSIKLEAKKTHLLAKDGGGRSADSGSQKQKPDGNREEIKECEKSFLRAEIENMEEQLEKIDFATDAALKNLADGKQYAVLYHRFVCRLSWDKIAETMDISKSHLYKLRRDGLEYLADHWKGDAA